MARDLILGTANFGSKYGLSQGMNVRRAEEILDWAKGRIEYLDCSIDYLGSHKAIKAHARYFKLFTKLSFPSSQEALTARKQLEQELSRLNTSSFFSVLVRGSETKDRRLNELFWTELNELRDEGLIENLGFSIYEPSELVYYEKSFWNIDFFQVPESLADRRFGKFFDGKLNMLEGSHIIARSIFLQGLLTMPINNIPHNLRHIVGFRLAVEKISRDLGVSCLSLLLGYVLSRNWVRATVLGVEGIDQLQQILEIAKRESELDFAFLDELPELNRKLTDPRQWDSTSEKREIHSLNGP